MGLFRKHDESGEHSAPATDEVIDLREEAPATSGTPALVWGAPAPCPKCSGRGYLDGIDPARGIMFQHCTECWHKYEVTESEVEASKV